MFMETARLSVVVTNDHNIFYSTNIELSILIQVNCRGELLNCCLKEFKLQSSSCCVVSA